MRKRCGVTVALLLWLLTFADFAAAAPRETSAARVPTSCRAALQFDGAPYGVLAEGISCSFARYWTKQYQNQGKHPRHWVCVGRGDFTEGGTCGDRRSTDFFEYYIED